MEDCASAHISTLAALLGRRACAAMADAGATATLMDLLTVVADKAPAGLRRLSSLCRGLCCTLARPRGPTPSQP